MITQTRNFEMMSDRYKYDFIHCTSAKGWAQIDTTQDASYYGTWTNPERREIFSYCEGDICLTHCDTDDDYRQALQECIDWNKQGGYWLGIDSGFNADITHRLEALGFGKELH